jgi:putative PIN family toxin of toxin-antitoxin system
LKIVLDTNLLLVSVHLKSQYRTIYDALRIGKYQLIVSNEVLTEYYELLSKFYSNEFAEVVIDEILNLDNVVLQEPYFKFELISIDPDDNKFADLAICSNSDFIVTQDNHYNILRDIKFPQVQTLNIKEFIDTISKL